MKNNKGFSLIELLAVIIILGVLMIIAIPSVTTYIQDARKNAYISTVKGLIDGTRNLVNSGKLRMHDTDVSYYIPTSCITTENDTKTPYGEFVVSNVIVNYDGDGYKFYWYGFDSSGTGIPEITSLDELDTDLIQNDLTVGDIPISESVGGRNKVAMLNDECTKFDAPSAAVTYKFSTTSTHTSETCEVTPEFTCNRANVGKEYITKCSKKYDFINSTSTQNNATSCSGSGTSFSCNASNVGRSYTTASVSTYSTYPSETTDLSNCTTTPQSFTQCNSSNLGRSYVSSCIIVGGSFSSVVKSNLSSCSGSSPFTCKPETNGQKYVICTKLSNGKWKSDTRTCKASYTKVTTKCVAKKCTKTTRACKEVYTVTSKTCEQS